MGKLAAVEIANRTRLNFARVDLGVINRLLAGLNDQMPDGFPFLFQVALKIRAPTADNINWLAHNIVNLANLVSLSSTAEGIDPGDVLANDQGVDVVRAFVGVDGLKDHEVTDDRLGIDDADCAQDLASFPHALQRHPDIVALRQSHPGRPPP